MTDLAMNKPRKAVYAGSFDPPHRGHLWMIENGAKLFDELIVTVGVNPSKKPVFTLEERVEMLRELTKNLPNVRVSSNDGKYTVNFAESEGALYVLKGLRTGEDFADERMQRNINEDINPRVTTVLLITPKGYEETSSSMIKGLTGYDGWQQTVKKYLPEQVYNKFLEKYRK